MNTSYTPGQLPLPVMVFTSFLILQACNSGDQGYDPEERAASHALPPATQSPMAQAITRHTDQQPGEHSGFLLLPEGPTSFVARLVLIQQARVSLDVQYYAFADDVSGNLIASKLLEAADRGVRVRLLVDDVATRVGNPNIVTLTEHQNMEVRVFNPVAGRSDLDRALEHIRNFGRINHRMHNKLLIADGVAMITGGRNIADEYFAGDGRQFLDTDVLIVGNLLPRAASAFDEYWNHDRSVPVAELMLDDDDSLSLEEMRTRIKENLQEHADSEFHKAQRDSDFSQRLLASELEFEWGPATLFTDPPAKAFSESDIPEEELPAYELMQELSRASSRIRMSSAYFVPGERGEDFFSDLTNRGMDIGVLTNSLSSTDTAAVYSAYSHSRRPLLEAGVQLWELRPSADQERKLHWFEGSSSASLHAKTFVIDDDRVFIGSINMDSRSRRHNTEIGVLIENAAINNQLNALFEDWVAPDSAWRLTLGEGDRLTWTGKDDGQRQTWYKEPETSTWDRFVAWLLSWLPIESQV
ncbi:phospholipase D family protein [Microbulbifer yueqingensis]|uniref:Putative cardiolipin synthase n=1 Tax=Microbulbifer yueqingensis TaxID=658219 RepID=A0A1G8ZBT3_9GAMM|nr:phospholipase D family protein [Microbulbifer yueqingensis]SDK12487.1 putative cardiolipin synthase [Microbulbifer yueqingensis]